MCVSMYLREMSKSFLCQWSICPSGETRTANRVSGWKTLWCYVPADSFGDTQFNIVLCSDVSIFDTWDKSPVYAAFSSVARLSVLLLLEFAPECLSWANTPTFKLALIPELYLNLNLIPNELMPLCWLIFTI